MKLPELSAAADELRARTGVMDEYNDHYIRLRELCVRAYRTGQLVPREAVEGAIRAMRAFLPKGIDLTNMNWADGTVVPLDTTLGELRQLAAALASLKENERGR